MNQTSASRIALYGGAFDPAHLGHASVISLLKRSGLVDQIWIVPTGDRTDKASTATAAQRIKMVELLIEECFPKDQAVKVVKLQAEGQIPGNTIGLLDHLKENYPSNSFFVVIGHELLQDLPSWAEAERLRQQAKFIIISRPGIDEVSLPKGYQCELLRFKAHEGVKVSSTELRAKLKRKENISSLVPKSVNTFLTRLDF